MAQTQQSPTTQSSQGGQSGRSPETQNRGAGGLARRDFSFPLTPAEMLTMHPFSLMRRMSEEMDRMFADVLTGGGARGAVGGSWAPAIEVKQQGNQYIVSAELPGLKKEDVKVDVQENTLVIQGERKFEHQENTGGVHRTERRYGQFYRAVPLPEGVEADKARARFENGMLEISVPVAQQNQPRQIPIETGQEGAASSGAGQQPTGATQSTTANAATAGQQTS